MSSFITYFRILALLVAMLPFYRSVAQESLVLSGASNYSEFNSGIYIAGLYLSQKSSDVQYILSPDITKRMQIVVTKNNWSKLNWKRHWRNRIAVSNPETGSDRDVIRALSSFSTLVKGELTRGDEVVVDYRSGVSSIRLNGELVLETQGVDVFNYLVLTWVGDVPPSSSFRNAILDGNSDSLWDTNRNMLDGYRFPSNRGDIYAKWVSVERSAKEEERKKIAALKAKQRAEIEKIARQKTAPKKVAVVAPAPKKPNAQVSAKKAAALQKEREIRQRAAAEAYYQEMLGWQIQRYVNKFVVYPHWAKSFSEEGLVTLSFSMSKSGEFEVRPNDSGVDSMLVKEVERVVKKSIENVSLPQNSSASDWELAVSYLFSLAGERLPEPVVPEKPEHLIRKGTSGDERDVLVETYREYLLEAIERKIVYPEAAKMLRQRGLVSANATVNRWGQIEQVEFVKKNRHKNLNEALKDAIEKNSPYKMFPLELDDVETISVTIEHKFR